MVLWLGHAVKLNFEAALNKLWMKGTLPPHGDEICGGPLPCFHRSANTHNPPSSLTTPTGHLPFARIRREAARAAPDRPPGRALLQPIATHKRSKEWRDKLPLTTVAAFISRS